MKEYIKLRNRVFIKGLILIGLLAFGIFCFQNCKNSNYEQQKAQTQQSVKVDSATCAPTSNEWFCKTLDRIDKKARLIGQNGAYWPNGSVLHIGFIGGTAAQRKYPIDAFAEWSKYCNLTFDFPSAGPYNCRISFDPTDGAWSYIGTDAKSIPQNEATLNLGWDGMDVALHEIGHFLGSLHEQQSPFSGICWNENNVIKSLSGPPNNWSEQMIRDNVINKYSPNQVTGSIFDPTSIMEYQIPSTWTCNGVGIPGGKVLSALDKQYIALRYPGKNTPPPANVVLTKAQAQEIVNRAQIAKTATDSLLALAKRRLSN